MAMGYSIFAGLVLIGFSTSKALILNYVIAVPLNFLTTGKFVFDSFRLQPLARFIFVYVLIFIINWSALRLAMNLGIGELLAQAVIVPFMAILSFLIFKYAVFRRL